MSNIINVLDFIIPLGEGPKAMKGNVIGDGTLLREGGGTLVKRKTEIANPTPFELKTVIVVTTVIDYQDFSYVFLLNI